MAKAVGPERMLRWIPIRDAIEAGALVVPGSDWSDRNPFEIPITEVHETEVLMTVIEGEVVYRAASTP